MKKILSQFFVLFMFFGIIFTPRIVYAYRHIGIDPSSIKPVTVTFVPKDGSWEEDLKFTNDNTDFTVNSPSADGKYIVGEEITLSVTPHKYWNYILPGGFSSGLKDNIVMTVVKNGSVQKQYRVDYSGDDLGNTFTDSFTPTEEGTYIINVFFRGNSASGSNLGNYNIQVEKALPETEKETETESPEQEVPKVGTKLTDSGSGLVYTVSKKGKEVSVKGVSGKKKTITIPKTIKLKGVKYKVTAISANAFKGNNNIQKVTVGSNVVKIGKRAFSGCNSLKQVTLPSSVRSLGKETFQNSKKLSKITIKTTKLTSKTVGANAFKGIYAKAAVKVPKSKLKAYTTLLKKKGAPKKVKIK